MFQLDSLNELSPMRQQQTGMYWLPIHLSRDSLELGREPYILVEQSQLFPGSDLNAIFTECICEANQFGSGAIDKLSERYPRQR